MGYTSFFEVLIIMNRLTIISFCLLLLYSCADKKKPSVAVPATPQRVHTIAILPLTTADKDLVRDIEAGIKKVLHADITILEQQQLPVSSFYKPRQRYIADSLLDFLERENNKRFEKMIGITAKDISTRKGPHVNWGVMGLGNCPGESCVISSFRVNKSSKDRGHFIKRMILLALHELGHTYSLPHCPDGACIMKDAEGKMNLDDGESYCNDCSNTLRKEGVLR
jgi:archaemetzincin